MIVICKKATKRLVKGVRYEVDGLWNDGKNQRWLEGTVQIKGIGRFTVNNFVDESGNPLPTINIAHQRELVTRIEWSDLKEGDILVCDSEHYKSLVKDGMYRIEKKISNTKSVKNWQGNIYTRTENKIKFVGIPRTLKFNSWGFRKLTASEQREISLSQVLDGTGPNIIQSTKIRKIDLIKDKNPILIKALCQSILDPNRHVLSVVDWACQKTGDKWDLQPEDFKDFLNKPLSEILQNV